MFFSFNMYRIPTNKQLYHLGFPSMRTMKSFTFLRSFRAFVARSSDGYRCSPIYIRTRHLHFLGYCCTMDMFSATRLLEPIILSLLGSEGRRKNPTCSYGGVSFRRWIRCYLRKLCKIESYRAGSLNFQGLSR